MSLTPPVLYLVICGTPAAPGAYDFISQVQADGWNVCAITTPAGARFVDPARLEAVTGHPVRSEYKQPEAPDVLPAGDAFVVAPASFNTVNKIANGISDTLGDPGVFDEVVFTSLWFPSELEIAPPASVDLVLTFRNVHNWFDAGYGQDPEQVFGAFFAALKPGGILGVVDHRWPDAATEDPAAAMGYVSEERVRALAEAAGFEFVGSSDINRNPLDTHDHPNGVWTLPPDLAVPEGGDRQKYLDIGESDRLTLKFRKPATE